MNITFLGLTIQLGYCLPEEDSEESVVQQYPTLNTSKDPDLKVSPTKYLYRLEMLQFVLCCIYTYFVYPTMSIYIYVYTI